MVVIAVLWLIAVVISHTQDMLFVHCELASNILGVCHTMIRLGIVGAWGISIPWRITSPQVKRRLIIIATLMLLWMLLRTARYYFVDEGLLKRLLWYAYYIPMMLIPPIALMAVLSMNRSDDYRTPKYLRVLLVVGALFALIVLTNEFHQWVFSWDDPLLRIDDAVHYTPLYYVMAIWEYGCGVVAFIVVVTRSRIPGSNRRLWLPIVPIMIMMIYGLLYIHEVPLIRTWFYDLTSIMILLYISVFECVIQCGLFHSCEHYQALFDASSLRAAITNKALTIYSAGQGFSSQPDDLHAAVDQPYLRDTIRLSGKVIHGGYVFWQDDLSEIMKTIHELQSINEELSEQKTLTREELRIRQEQTHLKEINRIYGVMQKETAGQLTQMQQLIDALEKEDTPETQRTILDRLLLIGAYFKRRNNLIFLAEADKTIPADELRLCLEESLHTMTGVMSVCRVTCREPVLLRDATTLYDLTESALEQLLGQISSCAILVSCASQAYQLQISVQVSDDTVRLAFDPAFAVETEAEGGLVLTASVQKGGGMV